MYSRIDLVSWAKHTITTMCLVLCLALGYMFGWKFFLDELKRIELTVVIFLISLVATMCYIIPTFYLRPYNLLTCINRIFYETFSTQFITLTKIHVLERYGISIHNSLLDDLSPSFREKSKNRIAKNIRLLHSFETKVLDDLEREEKDSFQQWISYNIMHWYLSTTLFGHNLMVYAPPLFGNLPTIYPCNSYRGAIYALYLTIHSIQSLDDEDEIYHYITRIRRTKNYVEHIIEDFDLRIKKNIIPPVDTIIKSNEQIKDFIELPGGMVENHFIYQRVSQQINNYRYHSRVKILNSVKKVILDSFIPPLQRLIDYQARIIPNARKTIGLWCLPNGEELYRFHTYFYTSTTLCPMDLNEIGYRELERIQREIIFLAKPEFTFNSTKETFGQFLNRIVFDPIFTIRSDDSGKKETLSYLKDTYYESRSKMSELFENLPNISIDFEETMIGHFEPNPFLYKPAVGEKNAVLFVNFDHSSTHSKLLNKVSVFKEGIPGHHLQLLSSNKIKNDTFRKFFINCSFYDGWGHYAEGLAVEYGWLKNKWEKLAHHIMDLRSTCRLITDCSIHFEGIQWSKERACKFLVEQGGFDVNEVDHEVNKLAIIPGSGLSQKIGQMKIVEIREYAKSQLRERFSIKKFHSVLLDNGSLPLDVLFQVVEYWINEQLEYPKGETTSNTQPQPSSHMNSGSTSNKKSSFFRTPEADSPKSSSPKTVSSLSSPSSVTSPISCASSPQSSTSSSSSSSSSTSSSSSSLSYSLSPSSTSSSPSSARSSTTSPKFMTANQYHHNYNMVNHVNSFSYVHQN